MKTSVKFLLLAISAVAFTSCESDEPSHDAGIAHEWKWTNEYLEPLSRVDMTEVEKDVNDQVNDFAYKFLESAVQDQETATHGNVAVSPLSAAVNLAMIANIGDGALAQNIANAMGYDDIETLNSVCNKLLCYLPSKHNEAILHLANSVWHENDYTPKDMFISKMNKVFGADVASYDYDNKYDAITSVNDWCSKNTNGMIPSFISDIASNVYLFNAMYFFSEWDTEIKVSDTKSATFRGAAGDSKVKMMKTVIKTGCRMKDNFIEISIPFEDCRYSLSLILPNEGVSTKDVIKNLSGSGWAGAESKSVEATIKFPRFSIEQTLGLEKVLENLGISTADVDLNGIGIDGRRRVSVMQKTILNINEKGAEASSVTGGYEFTDPGIPMEFEKMEITFDRPFVYQITNQITRSVIVAGQVCNL